MSKTERVVVVTGANTGIGAAFAKEITAAGITKVVLLGMQVPPNYGRKYGDEFTALFGSVAKAGGAALVPFILDGVANAPNAETLFQSDRIHPLATAHPRMLANVWPVLAPLLK